jgi:ubiquinone/menaquinone biosynthesis C-methylase UbiE
MEHIETAVASHYGVDGVAHAILNAIGKEPVTVDDLAEFDEFHIGGRDVTAEIARAMKLAANTRVLDIGCGIGGAARYIASHFGAHVTGVDLTPGFIDAARMLTEKSGMDGRVEFQCASALKLPFQHASFDSAYMFHVGMNIADKAGLFAEARRVLRNGGAFAVYDVMRTSPGDSGYPVPWASTPDMSFTETPDAYRELLAKAGFQVIEERERVDLARAFFARMKERVANGTAPGLSFVMGPTARVKVANMVASVDQGIFAPVEMICRAD